ncbi:MAG: Ig-like domain-containing protein [Verrucomicrobiia bacterium]
MRKRRLFTFGNPTLAVAVVTFGCVAVLEAASASFYGFGKTREFEQSGESGVVTASRGPFRFDAFAIPTEARPVLVAALDTPGAQQVVILQPSGGRLTASASFGSQTELDAAYPSGTYSMVLVSDSPVFEGPAEFQYPETDFPVPPEISNFAAAQAVDPSSEFTLAWNAFEGATGSDYVWLSLVNSSGAAVFQTGLPGEANALGGSARTVSIQANSLEPGAYTARLAFVRVIQEDSTSYSGAVGRATMASETVFPVEARLTGPDTTSPVLTGTSPVNGATNMRLDTRVLFQFSEAMASTQVITWSANVVASDFSYSWSPDQRTLTCTYSKAFPANSTIGWTLLGSGFRDLAGNPLGSETVNGSFSTGTSGSNVPNPCDPDANHLDAGSVSVSKMVYYGQSASGEVVMNQNAAMFFATVSSPTNNPVLEAALTLPGGSTKPLMRVGERSLILQAPFESQEALDTAYPSGTYTVTVKRTVGTFVVALDIPASGPPTPQITNLAETKDFDATANFELKWLPFTGVAPSDSLFIMLQDNLRTNFHAPDPCIPIPLANTAISIIVPGMTFASSTQIEGALSFTKFGGADTSSIPDMPAFSSIQKMTTFEFLNAGLESDRPAIRNLIRQQDGVVRFEVTSKAGATVRVQASANLQDWTPIQTGASPEGLLIVTDPAAATLPWRFYRASTD